MKILIFGVSGMLGSTLIRYFSKEKGFEVFGTARSLSSVSSLEPEIKKKIFFDVDANNFDSIEDVFSNILPELVINCVGLVKQLYESNDPVAILPINSIFPHRLAKLCGEKGVRLVHISTDCVFSGRKGMYKESDFADAQDLYGVSKRLGELSNSNSITLRTSILGHELNSNKSLVEWFLSQDGPIKGFKNAYFSGLPCVEIARIIKDHVIPNPRLSGLYHVSANPINKYDLLNLIAATYKKNIFIEEDLDLKIDRSLDCSEFKKSTGFKAKPWGELIYDMYKFR